MVSSVSWQGETTEGWNVVGSVRCAENTQLDDLTSFHFMGVVSDLKYYEK